MISSGCAVVTTAYFPPVEYFMAAAAAGELKVEDSESYVKQSYRNRCRIYACDGVLSLTVPVSAADGGKGIRDMRIDYSAYRTSAFFEYYKDDLFAVMEAKPETLFELNTALTVKLLGLLGLRCPLSFTGEYVPEYGPDVMDLRESIHPKKTVPEMFRNRFKPYYQVFYEKFGFIPGLSALDLLFNEGPNALSFL